MEVNFGSCVTKAQGLPGHIIFSQPLAEGISQWKGDKEWAGF